MALRLAFLGTSPFAVPALRALVAAGHELAAVYTQPPRPAGRGQRDQYSPVHLVADELGLPVRTPPSLRREEPQAAFRDLGLDAAVVAAYGLILPTAVLEAPRLGCFNVHGSLLPRWRGAAPIERAILAGDAETGVTIMQMDEGLDTGPVLLMERVPITAATTAEDLHRSLGELGAGMMCRVLFGVADGSLVSTPQPADGATYARKLERDEGVLDWQRPAVDLDRVVRALNPAPGVWFVHGGERLRVIAARPEPGTGDPGRIVDDRLGVACAEGVLRLTRLQRPGRAALDADAFLRGYRLPKGTQLA